MIKTEIIMKNNDVKSLSKGNREKPKKNRFLLIFICIFMTVIIAVGAVLGIIAYVKKKNSVVSYGSYMLSSGEANFFASRFKNYFLVSLGSEGYDTDWFWESESPEGKTYGTLLEEGYREYIASILVASSLFDRYAKLERSDKEIIKEITENTLERFGSEEKFNEAAAKYGFDYDDYKNAAEYLYKVNSAQTAIFGQDGSKLSSFPEECDEFYRENYSRVSLMFLRDEEIIETDENGSMYLRPITEEEKADRESYAKELRDAISNAENGTDGKRITPEMFEFYYRKSDSDMDMYRSYYFSEYAESTSEFMTEFPEIVEKALSMKTGEYAEVECSIGICFIYKEELDTNGYTDKDNPFFSDFYSDAVYPIYSEMLSLYASDVEFSEKFESKNILSIPKNYEFAISFTQ